MRRSHENTHNSGGYYYRGWAHLYCLSIPVLQGSMHYLYGYLSTVFMGGIRQSPPSENKSIVSERGLVGRRSLGRRSTFQAGSASFHDNQSYPTSSPCFIIIKHSLADSASRLGIVGPHWRHDYAVLH